jgi:hypothetical protein
MNQHSSIIETFQYGILPYGAIAVDTGQVAKLTGFASRRVEDLSLDETRTAGSETRLYTRCGDGAKTRL